MPQAAHAILVHNQLQHQRRSAAASVRTGDNSETRTSLMDLAVSEPDINLKGVIIGNAFTDPAYDFLAITDFAFQHAFISNATRSSVHQACKGDAAALHEQGVRPDPLTICTCETCKCDELHT